MNLSTEQKQTLATWVAAGDNLSTIQKKLHDEFHVTLTYMDVRFLVDDLDLSLKDPAPAADASDVSKPPAPPPAAASPYAPSPTNAYPAGDAADANYDHDEFSDDDALPPHDAVPPAPANVTVNVDPVTLLPGALASGTVRFSDGVTGKWMVDNYGRPGFTEISQPGYQPSPADAQAFIQELSRHL